MSALKLQTDLVRIVGGGGQYAPAVLFADPSEHFVLVPERKDPGVYAAVDTSTETTVVEADARVPAVLDRLIEELTPVREVLAIIAESMGRLGALHITVFAQPVLAETRERVYAIEQVILDEFADMAFDFHLREPERVDGHVVIPPAPQALVLWHRVDVDAVCP